MNCSFQRSEDTRTKNTVYALPVDFCKAFNENVDSLYTLALLLTADHDKAEQCFVAGLDDCLEGGPVFREWVRSWARRTVVKNAVRMISPLQNHSTLAGWKPVRPAQASSVVTAIMSLQPFDRFAYVLSVLERYPDRECAVLLECTAGHVVQARSRAIQQLGDMSHGQSLAQLPLKPGENLMNHSCGEML